MFLHPINLIGLFNDHRGIGQVAQGLRSCLSYLDLPFVESDLTDLAQGSVFTPPDRQNELFLNLSVINPSETSWVFEKFGKDVYKGRYNIAHWSWEFENSIPQSWRRHIGLFDELWSPSDFITRTFANQFQLPAHTVSPIVSIKEDRSFCRADFDIKSDEFVFLFVCDFKSIAERKNPLAAVKAFKNAFAKDDQAKFVLKLSSGDTNPDYLQQLHKESENLNVLLIDEIMPREKMDSLFTLCDAYISLHRSEGFGMTMAEAMLAGKPVIATGWSGNLDFMNDENSYLVRHKLIELDRNYGLYMAGECWAEPDIEHAAEQMRLVYENRGIPDLRAQKAAQFIDATYSLPALAKRVEERLLTVAPFIRALERMSAEKISYARVSRLIEAASVEVTAIDDSPQSSACEGADCRSKAPLVSICLPVFDGAEFLEQAIKTALKQTFTDFELLISDDCSTDASLQIIKKFAKADNRIRFWTNKERLGLFENYNHCIRQARGAYIKLFAQDDLLEPDLLREQVEVLHDHKEVSLVCCDKIFINELGSPFQHEDFAYLQKLEEQIIKDKPMAGRDVIAACFFPVVNLIGEPTTVMFRKDVAGSGFDSNYYHVGDLDYWFQILLRGQFYRISKRLCRFRWHSGSTTTRNIQTLLHAIDTLKLGRKYLAVLNDYGYTHEEFLSDAIYCLAAQSLRLSDRDLFAGASVIASLMPAVSAGDFHELAFRALQYAGRCNQSAQSTQVESAYSKKPNPVSILEDEVRNLLESPCWRVTKVLRDVNRVVSRGASSSLPENLSKQGFDESDYIQHLEDLKSAILDSRSWKLTSPIRSINPNA